MKLKMVALVAGLMLSTSVFACPNEVFQRQTGSFDWMVSGSFNGQRFSSSGSSYAELVASLERYLAALRNHNPKDAQAVFVPVTSN